jgi:hypothetical protein
MFFYQNDLQIHNTEEQVYFYLKLEIQIIRNNMNLF